MTPKIKTILALAVIVVCFAIFIAAFVLTRGAP